MSKKLELIAEAAADVLEGSGLLTDWALPRVLKDQLARVVVSRLSEHGYSIVEAFCKCGHRSGAHTELHRSCSVELGTWICPCEGYANG